MLMQGIVLHLLLLVINSIDETRPAYKADLRKLHIGWNIISVNDINSCKTEKILEILESTKKNNNKFTIEIQPIFEINSDNDLTLKFCWIYNYLIFIQIYK